MSSMNWKSSHPNVLYRFIYFSVSWSISVCYAFNVDSCGQPEEVGSDNTIGIGDIQSKIIATKGNKEEDGKKKKRSLRRKRRL